MDNQNPDQNLAAPSKWGSLINKKNILILLGAVVVAELLWAGWTISQTNKQINQTPPAVSTPISSQIGLSSDKTAVKEGEQFTVSANILSDQATDGVDLIINYDPKLISVVQVGETNAPVILGSLYNDYPINTLDSKAGKITVSGISTQTDGIKPNGLFGSIIFKAESSGQALISLDFEAGSTVDTNIIEKGTGEDNLEKVNSLEINIQ